MIDRVPPSLLSLMASFANPTVVRLQQQGDDLVVTEVLAAPVADGVEAGDIVEPPWPTVASWADPVLASGDEHVAVLIVPDSVEPSLLALFDADGHIAQPGQRPVMAEVDTHLDGDLVARLTTLVERATAPTPTAGLLEEPRTVDPVDAWLGVPPEQRYVDPGSTPQEVLDRFTVPITVVLDLPDEAKDRVTTDDFTIRLAAPAFATLLSVGYGAGDLFSPVFVPEGEVVVRVVSFDGSRQGPPSSLGDLRAFAASLPEGEVPRVTVVGIPGEDGVTVDTVTFTLDATRLDG